MHRRTAHCPSAHTRGTAAAHRGTAAGGWRRPSACARRPHLRAARRRRCRRDPPACARAVRRPMAATAPPPRPPLSPPAGRTRAPWRWARCATNHARGCRLCAVCGASEYPTGGMHQQGSTSVVSHTCDDVVLSGDEAHRNPVGLQRTMGGACQSGNHAARGRRVRTDPALCRGGLCHAI
jgi:hypothetical protein